VEEKYQKEPKLSKGIYGDKYDEDSESSSDEDEDDEGFLATEALDAQISATLQAIRNKDPRVYDEKVTFYSPAERDEEEEEKSRKEGKPMYLLDYHRENLLNGYIGAEDQEEVPALRTFAQEQEELKRTIVSEMHAAAMGDVSSEDPEDGDDSGFLVRKAKSRVSKERIHASRAAKVEVDVTIADKDPETFLSNFMAARAWVPTDGARFQPLESDDEEEDERAEKFEAAYNLRFEDPQGSNEVLKSYARDIVAARSVRREEPKSRKRQREVEREKKEAEKKQREEERTRLRRLKIEEMEQKLQKIKKAAGLRGQTLKDEEWMKFLDEGWNDETWEAEMNKQFGDDYYAQEEAQSAQGSDTEEADGPAKKKKKMPKKPKWDDEIDITDIIPEFQDEEESNKRSVFTLTDSESVSDEDEPSVSTKKSKSSRERQEEKLAKKKAARLERKKIEELVDNRLDLDGAIVATKSKEPSKFRYRETSPTTFGLTARDILMAPDASLNQFAGLKKMATFRDAEKKRKDKRKLGKKARLREWRRETFGNEDGPQIIIASATVETAVGKSGPDIIDGKRKRKRSKKNKAQGPE
jgi:protein KRI1